MAESNIKANSSSEISEDTKTIVTIVLLIFVTPAGIILMWVWTHWQLWVKVLITSIFTLYILFWVIIFGVMIAAIIAGIANTPSTYSGGAPLQSEETIDTLMQDVTAPTIQLTPSYSATQSSLRR